MHRVIRNFIALFTFLGVEPPLQYGSLYFTFAHSHLDAFSRLHLRIKLGFTLQRKRSKRTGGQGRWEEPCIVHTRCLSAPQFLSTHAIGPSAASQLLLRYQCLPRKAACQASGLFFSPTLAVPQPPCPPGSEAKRSGKGSQHLNERPLSPHAVIRGVEGVWRGVKGGEGM